VFANYEEESEKRRDVSEMNEGERVIKKKSRPPIPMT
jgi:hypothetical protein